MASPSLYSLFQGTCHPDAQLRNEAENELKRLQSTDGFLTSLLQWIGNNDTDPNIRQAMAIFFKNRIIRGWEVMETSVVPVGPQDRDFVKANLVAIMVLVDSKLRTIFAACLHSILAIDFPSGKWPSFLSSVLQLLQSSETNQVETGLAALWEVVSLYRFKAAEKRQPLVQIVESTFPLLLVIANNLVTRLEEVAGRMLHRVFKIYYASMQFELSSIQQEPSSLIPWGNVLMQTIEKEIPLNILPEDNADREKFCWWKAKKWAYHSIHHLFSKYGVQGNVTKNSKYAQFAKNFMENFAPSILQMYIKQMQLLISGVWMSNRSKQQISLLLSDCVKQKNLWFMMKPHLETIVFHYIFPQLCLTDDDIEQWECDPVEYIQRKMDPMEDFRSSVAAAQGLLTSLVKNRFKHTFLPIMQFVTTLLATYNTSPPQDRNPRHKDGAIHLVSCLASEILGKKSPIRDQIEDFLAANVLPEFRSDHAFLRARACDVLMKFETDPMPREANLFEKPEHIQFIFESLIRCMQDADLPVRVWGALTLREYMNYEEIREGLKPHVPNVMQILLNLTNEIDMDTLSQVMETVASTYPEELAPYAVQLGTQLRDSFLRIVSEIDYDNDDADIDEAADRTMAAIGIMKTISTLVISLDSSIPILQELEKEIGPVIHLTLEKNILDLYDDAFEIIDSFTFCTKSVSPTMWSFFPLIYKAFKTDAIDYLEEMLPSLDNYISFGSQVFAANKEFQNMLFDIIQTILTNDSGEADYVRACQLAESMFLNLKDSMDLLVPGILDLAFHHLNNAGGMKTASFKVHCIEIVVNALFYNPGLTLGYLEQKGATTPFFTMWFGEMENFMRVHDKKLVILTLCKLVALPPTQLPVSLQSGMSQLFSTVLKTFASFPDAVAERKRAKEMFEGDEDDEDDEVDYDFDNDDEDDDFEDDDDDGNDPSSHTSDKDVRDEEDSYLEYLDQKDQNGDQSFEQSDYGDDDEYGVAGLEEDPYFVTVLDQLDPYIVFQEIMSTRIPVEQQQALLNNLSAEDKGMLEKVFSEANKNRDAAAAAAAAAANGTANAQ